MTDYLNTNFEPKYQISTYLHAKFQVNILKAKKNEQKKVNNTK